MVKPMTEKRETRRTKIGDTVKVHYTGQTENGNIFETTVNKDPLEFTIGDENILPGFEYAVIGMRHGELKTVKIPANEAHGPHYEELVMAVDREQLPSNIEPKEGQKLDVQLSDDIRVQTVITDVSGSKVTLDANHPLAGKDLIFNIQLLEIV